MVLLVVQVFPVSLGLQMEELSFPIIIIMHQIQQDPLFLLTILHLKIILLSTDPGETITGPALYPKLAILPNNDILIAAFSSDVYLNKLSGGIFSGWGLVGGGGPETYSLAVSENGSKIGLVCLGDPLTNQAHWVLYNESTDGGLTWYHQLLSGKLIQILLLVIFVAVSGVLI